MFIEEKQKKSYIIFNTLLILIKMSNQNFAQGGLWNTTRAPISSETQNLMKVMMQEAKLTSFQRRTLNNTMQSNFL